MNKTIKSLAACFLVAFVALVLQAQPFGTAQPGLTNHIIDHEGKAWRKSGPNKKPQRQFRFIVVDGVTITVHPDDHQYLINLVRSCVRDDLRNRVKIDEWQEGIGGGYLITIDGTDWARETHRIAELVMNSGEWAARAQLQNEMRSQDLL